MPEKILSCISLPLATLSFIPTYNFAKANEELAKKSPGLFYPCCGKSICKGCIHSFCVSGNIGKCPFCNCKRAGKTLFNLKRVEANDPGAIWMIAGYYYQGLCGLQQDHTKAMELYNRAADLGYSKAHGCLGDIYKEGGNMKKAKFHFEAAAMAGNDVARSNLEIMEAEAGNMERAVKHWMIAASAGCYIAMHLLRTAFEDDVISRKSIDSSLTAYNSSCAEMRSEARDASIRFEMGTIM
jgi:tetratricopeptide (TPR) repeat protein